MENEAQFEKDYVTTSIAWKHWTQTGIFDFFFSVATCEPRSYAADENDA